MTPPSVHSTLLAPAILHILRAAGFHSTRPSVLDTLTDLCARYILLLASRVMELGYNRSLLLPASDDDDLSIDQDASLARSDDLVVTSLSSLEQTAPTVSDVRHALSSVAFFSSALTATEEAWQELLRKPLETIPVSGREKERSRRDLEDTKDIREFIDWAKGPANSEIRRVAGLLQDEQGMSNMVGAGPGVSGPGLGDLSSVVHVDYITSLKKKHSKTADATRFSGTVLGKPNDDRSSARVEGGPSFTEIRAKRRMIEFGSRDI